MMYGVKYRNTSMMKKAGRASEHEHAVRIGVISKIPPSETAKKHFFSKPYYLIAGEEK